MPSLRMLVGVPGSGKSTWIAQQCWPEDRVKILSTDRYLDQIAQDLGTTYDQVFQDHIAAATAKLELDLEHAIKQGLDIVWDQTNLTAKSRAKKLAKIPESYHRHAVVFMTPSNQELRDRLSARVGKTIPQHVMQSMIRAFEVPDRSEGFDHIVVM